jgi:hypothetical protein
MCENKLSRAQDLKAEPFSFNRLQRNTGGEEIGVE